MRMIHYQVAETILQDIYQAKGVPQQEAVIVARLQVEANLVGHDSHGVIQTARYVSQLDQGEIVPGVPLTIKETSSTTAEVDGNWGFGYVQTERAVKHAITAARKHGTYALTIRAQGHIGRLGAYADMAAREGMIMLLAADSGRGPKSVAPFGGRTRRLGTNPICVGMPVRRGDPIVLDMATSAVAAGKVTLSQARGELVPLGWLLDQNGQPTTNPKDLAEGGALLPLGGDQGHKGYGLSVIVELLCGVLTGVGFGVAADGRINDACFVAAFDPDRFRPVGAFAREADEFIRYLKESPPVQGCAEVMYPGEIETRTARHRRIHGFPIEEQTWNELTSLLTAHGLQVPELSTSERPLIFDQT